MVTVRAKTKKCNPLPAINDSLPIVPYYVHNQTGFGKSVINGTYFMYLGISKMDFTY